jgi:hypothetical protein
MAKVTTLFKIYSSEKKVIHAGYTTNFKRLTKWVENINPDGKLSGWEKEAYNNPVFVEVVKETNNKRFAKAARKHLVDNNKATILR